MIQNQNSSTQKIQQNVQKIKLRNRRGISLYEDLKTKTKEETDINEITISKDKVQTVKDTKIRSVSLQSLPNNNNGGNSGSTNMVMYNAVPV